MLLMKMTGVLLSEPPASKVTEPWKGRTVFQILPGGIENRTSVPAKTRDPTRRKVGSPEEELAKVSLETAQPEQERPEALHRERYR